MSELKSYKLNSPISRLVRQIYGRDISCLIMEFLINFEDLYDVRRKIEKYYRYGTLIYIMDYSSVGEWVDDFGDPFCLLRWINRAVRDEGPIIRSKFRQWCNKCDTRFEIRYKPYPTCKQNCRETLSRESYLFSIVR